MSDQVRVLASMVGSLEKSDIKVKYGTFLEAVNSRFHSVQIYNAGLNGIEKYINAMITFSPKISAWKEKYFKNVQAFARRSHRMQKFIKTHQKKFDVILQIGGLFDSSAIESGIPVVIYTDNTTMITSRYPNSGRFMFTHQDFETWIRMEKNLYQKAAHICVRSQLVKRSLITDYGIAEKNITVIGGGVNFSTLPGLPERKDRSKFSILFIGTDFYRKGGDIVLKAFSLLFQTFPQAELIIVTKETLPDQHPAAGVTIKKTIWDRKEIENLYYDADVFVLPSRYETWGDVVLEAMAFGIPCISVYGQPMEEIIIDGETGLLVNKENEAELAAALSRLAMDSELRMKMGKNARKLVIEKYSWERVVDRLAPIMIDAVNRYFYQPITNI